MPATTEELTRKHFCTSRELDYLSVLDFTIRVSSREALQTFFADSAKAKSKRHSNATRTGIKAQKTRKQRRARELGI